MLQCLTFNPLTSARKNKSKLLSRNTTGPYLCSLEIYSNCFLLISYSQLVFQMEHTYLKIQIESYDKRKHDVSLSGYGITQLEFFFAVPFIYIQISQFDVSVQLFSISLNKNVIYSFSSHIWTFRMFPFCVYFEWSNNEYE